MVLKRRPPTWEEPRRSILRRWRHGGITWAELECGHTIPATGWDLATALRCSECNPVPRRTEESVDPESWS